MSTKTSIKRIALVAVSALGFGLLSLAPANAARGTTQLTVDAITVTNPLRTVVVGNAGTSTFSFSASADSVATNAAEITASISKPTNSSVSLADSNGSGAGTPLALANTSADAGITTTIDDNLVVGTKDLVKVVTAGAVLAATNSVAGTISITPDVPGTYTVTLTGSNAGATSVANTVIATFTVVARSLAYTLGDASPLTPFDAGTGVAGPANSVTVTGYSTGTASRRSLITVSGSSATIALGGTVAANGLSTVINDASAADVSDATAVIVMTPVVGTITVSLFNETAAGSGIFSATASNTVTITVNAAAAGNPVDAANSTSVIKAGSTWSAGTSATTDDVVRAARAASTTPVAVVKVDLARALGAITGTTAVTASISGSGSLVLNSGALAALGTGRSLSSTVASTGETFYVAVLADGNSGVGTITITAGGFTSTETVTFFGSVASYVVTVLKSHVASSGQATTSVVEVDALDSAGTPVTNHTVFASASPTTRAAVSASAVTDADGSAYFDVTGLALASGEVTLSFGNAALAPTVTGTAKVTVSSIRAATLTVKTDKAEYAPGEKITFTLTAQDAAGLGLPSGSYGAGLLFASSSSNPLASSGITSRPFAGDAAVSLKGGVATATAFAPLVSGPISFTWTLAGVAGGSAIPNLSAALVGTTVTASATVGASAAENAANAAADAAAEAIDAANAATDAANLAAEAADAATVAAEEARDAADAATAAVEELAQQVATLMAALKAQITTLANTVAKIAKKVKA